VLRLTTAYSMLANGGRRIKPTLIDRIQDRWATRSSSMTSASAPPATRRLASSPSPADRQARAGHRPMTAYQISSMLQA